MDAPQRGHFLTDELFNCSTCFYRICSWKFCQKSLPPLHFFTVRTGVTLEWRLHSSAEQHGMPRLQTGSARLQHCQQMADFVVHILGGRYRLRDLLGKQFAVALAEPVNGGLHR